MKISVVSYLNSAPLVYGIQRSALLHGHQVDLDIPSKGAAKLAAGESDIALVPVGAFPDPKDVDWVGSTCIGVVGPVRTVCLFSEVPLEQIKQVYLDSHSRTSIQLIQVLAREFWNTHWQYLPAWEGFEKEAIRGSNAGVCIGDKVFGIEGRYSYRYDLAEEWIRFTGMPFVFAAWATRKKLKDDFLTDLDQAQQEGIKAIPDIARDWSLKIHLPESEIRDYLTRNISYPFTEEKKRGMNRFLALIRNPS